MALKNLPAVLTALDVMRDAPVIPVIVLNDMAHAVPLARALVAGGIRMLEVTLRTPVALQCIERIAQEVPGAVVGAGTVRSALDAQAAAKAGAKFAVSPGFTNTVGLACREAGLAGSFRFDKLELLHVSLRQPLTSSLPSRFGGRQIMEGG